jgi:uncharacterized protein YciI
MSTFAVTRQAGPGWAAGGIYDQPGMSEHAAFMNALAEEGFVLFGGPLAGTEQGRVSVLLIIDADSEATICRRLADDPWVASQQLVTQSVDPWTLLVGAERLPSPARAVAP